MRFISYIFLALAIVTLAGCQNQNEEQPPTPTSAAETAEEVEAQQETAEQAAVQESSEPAIKGRGNEAVFDVSREDALALLNGRFLLTTFMNQTEGIPVPLADQWRLEKVEAGEGDGRIFTFSSDEWILILQEPAPDSAGILYQAEISGPDLPRYIGSILADGTVSPVQ